MKEDDDMDINKLLNEMTDGTAPERPVKRCEAMAWLDRLGLLD